MCPVLLAPSFVCGTKGMYMKFYSFDKPLDTTLFSSSLRTVAVYYVEVTRLLLQLFAGYQGICFTARLFSFLRLASATLRQDVSLM